MNSLPELKVSSGNKVLEPFVVAREERRESYFVSMTREKSNYKVLKQSFQSIP